MKYRTYPNTDVDRQRGRLWPCGRPRPAGGARRATTRRSRCCAKPHDLGITLFDAADTYGNGRSEEQLAKAFAGRARRASCTRPSSATTFTRHKPRTSGAGSPSCRTIFRPRSCGTALEASLRRLQTDYVDIYQMHNARMAQIDDDALWELLESFKREGKIRMYGVALGPAIGWLYEGVDAVQTRNVREPADHLEHARAVSRATSRFAPRTTPAPTPAT